MGQPVALTQRLGAAAWMLAAVLAAGAGGAAPAWADAPPAMAGAPRCRFVVPDGWAAARTRWLGACAAGLAQGRGLLREYRAGRVVRSFYGTLQAGQPALGVVDLGDGFMAGEFKDGKLVPGAERDLLIRAFDEASAAARQVADGYRKARNLASARHYQDKARQLAEQID